MQYFKKTPFLPKKTDFFDKNIKKDAIFYRIFAHFRGFLLKITSSRLHNFQKVLILSKKIE